MNINASQPNLVDTVIPPDFLTKFHLGRCAFSYKGGCTTPGGQLTDLNIWDRALSMEDVIAWTSCRSFQKGNLVNWETGRPN